MASLPLRLSWDVYLFQPLGIGAPSSQALALRTQHQQPLGSQDLGFELNCSPGFPGYQCARGGLWDLAASVTT